MEKLSLLNDVQRGAGCVSLLALSIALLLGGPTTAEANQAPVISGTPPSTVSVGQVYSYALQASDPDGDKLSFDLWNAPSWLKIVNGKLTGTPGQAGRWAGIEIFAYDGKSWTPLPPFSIEARSASNRAPIISGVPTATATAGKPYSYSLIASDPDGDALSFDLWNAPTWLSISNGKLTGTPTTNGSWSGIEIFAYDGKTWTPLTPFTITVAKATTTVANSPPKISGAPVTTIKVGNTYAFTATASDANADKLTFAVANKPSWATFAKGTLTGKPTTAGTWSNIKISVSDGKATASLPAFAITASATNSAPVIAGTPPSTATVGVPYSYTLQASDPDGDLLSFDLSKAPAGFSIAGGKLIGLPTKAGTFSGIEIFAYDGKIRTPLPPFTITVKSSSGGPRIVGTPATAVNVGNAYSFTPSASDPDGDTLYFRVANKPSWATFSTTTGSLKGSPTVGQTGTFANIKITVTDGKTSVSLPIFSVSVAAAAAAVPIGSAALSWAAPTQNVDGSDLTTLAGYRIYYGTSAGALTQMIEVRDINASAYTVASLVANTYFFAIKAYTTDGAESELSNVASKIVL